LSGDSNAGQAGDGPANLRVKPENRRKSGWIEAELIDAARLLANEAAAGRSCGDCHVCCILLEIAALAKPPRESCVHLAGGQCSRYETRPDACRAFHCLWLRGALQSNDTRLRPENLGVLLDAYVSLPSHKLRIVAVEVWADALEHADARAILAALAEFGTVTVYYRDGRCSELTSDSPKTGDRAALPEPATPEGTTSPSS